MSEVAAVTGGRDYEDINTIAAVFILFGWPKLVLVGDAKGLDFWVRHLCRRSCINLAVFRANWTKYGKSAGPRRNREMLDAKPDYLLSFRGGKGTHDCTMEAIRRGIPVFFPDNIHFERAECPK